MAYKDGSRVRGGKSYRQHQSFKEFIRKRDNYTCQICGKEGWIVHHIVPYEISHETRPDGVSTLCHSCNLKVRRIRRSVRPSLEQWYRDIEEELRGK